MFVKVLKSSIIISLLSLLLCCSIPVAYAVMPSSGSIQHSLLLEKTVQVAVNISNQGSQTARDIKVQLPLISIDSPSQVIKKETFNHKVQNVQVNDNGNRMASFVIDSLAPGQTEILRVEYVLAEPNVHISDFDISKIGSYLQPGAKIQSDHPEIIALANKINADTANDLEKLENIANYIDSHMKYNDKSPAKNGGALCALRSGEGVCEDYATLYVALCRTSGIPARQVNGFADSERSGASWNKQAVVSLKGYRHSWAEVYVKDIGWVAVDPTFKIYPHSGQYAASLSSGHIGQNYQDESLRVSYQGGKLAVVWSNVLINK